MPRGKENRSSTQLMRMIRRNPGLLLRAADVIGLQQKSASGGEAPPCAFHRVQMGNRTWPYAVYSPPDSSSSPLPVILFLHGAGERGADGWAPTRVGIGPALCRFP